MKRELRVLLTPVCPIRHGNAILANDIPTPLARPLKSLEIGTGDTMITTTRKAANFALSFSLIPLVVIRVQRPHKILLFTNNIFNFRFCRHFMEFVKMGYDDYWMA